MWMYIQTDIREYRNDTQQVGRELQVVLQHHCLRETSPSKAHLGLSQKGVQRQHQIHDYPDLLHKSRNTFFSVKQGVQCKKQSKRLSI
jgi:hypothetical protein